MVHAQEMPTVTPKNNANSEGEAVDLTAQKPWISERCIDQPRPLKLIYIGAGVSGIIGAIEFLKNVPDLEMVIYEKNPEVGGTWYENRYPGCACDIPSHSYQLSFESWPRWSSFFSGSAEILAYWKRVVTKYGIRKHVRFSQQCISARWSATASKWFVQIRNLETNMTYEDSADVLMTGEGVLNEWKWPDIKGIENFEGTLLHSAKWDEAFDATDRSVAVIGAGSSGIQIVPALHDQVKSMDHYVRGRTWICSQWGGEFLNKRTHDLGGNFSYTEEEMAAWTADPKGYNEYRRALEVQLQNSYGITHSGSAQQTEARVRFTADMQRRLEAKPEIVEHLLPSFSPLCKRPTPGPGYLEALTSSKVNVISTPISHIEETGIVTVDGIHHPVDAIICATGFQASPGERGFPIYGRNGVNLRQRYAHRPETYLGLCTDGFPNFFQSLGPNAFQGGGNLLIVIEQIHRYVAQILRKLVFGNVGLIEPKRRSVESFTNHCDWYFKRTVYSETCDSWYKSARPGATREEKQRGRVTALWPGSSLHAVHVLGSVRWEDFEVQPLDGNDFGWFGNGWTLAERHSDMGNNAFIPYLDDTTLLDSA